MSKAAAERQDQQADEPSAESTLREALPPCDVALIFALRAESGGLVDRLSDVVTTRCASFLEYAGQLQGRRVVIGESGVGLEAAGQAAADMAVIHRPSWIISAGFAGGLSDQLRRGDILMAERVADTSGAQLAVGMNIDPQVLAATPGLHVGTLLTVDRLIRTPDEKRQLQQQHAALACDMESYAVAAACQEAKVRFLSVRVISDAADDELPPEVTKLMDQRTLAAKLGAATGAVLRRPSSVKDMWRLKEDALKASDRLAAFLVGVIEQLSGDA